jgi:hypothetical protein
VSAVLSPNSEGSISNAQPCSIEIIEGDWKAYVQHSTQCETQSMRDSFESILAYKRACALAYLGRRAQKHGGVCSTTHPHIMTQELIANLEAGNRIDRYARYPWLEAWTGILGEIERIQDAISTSSNVISILPNTK